jgi:hypothetical protein
MARAARFRNALGRCSASLAGGCATAGIETPTTAVGSRSQEHTRSGWRTAWRSAQRLQRDLDLRRGRSCSPKPSAATRAGAQRGWRGLRAMRREPIVSPASPTVRPSLRALTPKLSCKRSPIQAAYQYAGLSIVQPSTTTPPQIFALVCCGDTLEGGSPTSAPRLRWTLLLRRRRQGGEPRQIRLHRSPPFLQLGRQMVPSVRPARSVKVEVL